MRILWLKSDLLLPLDKGGRLRTWHLMRHLAHRHEITYLAFAERGEPAERIDAMREVAARIETVPRSDPPKGSWRFYADAALTDAGADVLAPMGPAIGALVWLVAWWQPEPLTGWRAAAAAPFAVSATVLALACAVGLPWPGDYWLAAAPLVLLGLVVLGWRSC